MVSSNEDIENILMPLIDDLAPKLKQEIKEELTGPLNVAWHAILLIKLMNTPTGASTNPKNFDLNKNLNMNLI